MRFTREGRSLSFIFHFYKGGRRWWLVVLCRTGNSNAFFGPSWTILGQQRCTPTSSNSTSLKCLLPRAEHNQTFATAAPLLWNATLGFAAISPDVTLDSRFAIHSVSPQFVSRGGSAELTIKGSGFTVAAKGCDRLSHYRLLPHLVSKVPL